MPGMIVLDCLHLLLIDLKIFKLEKKGKKGKLYKSMLCITWWYWQETVCTWDRLWLRSPDSPPPPPWSAHRPAHPMGWEWCWTWYRTCCYSYHQISLLHSNRPQSQYTRRCFMNIEYWSVSGWYSPDTITLCSLLTSAFSVCTCSQRRKEEEEEHSPDWRSSEHPWL